MYFFGSLLGCLLLLMAPGLLWGQSAVAVSEQQEQLLWFRYQLELPFHPGWEFEQEVEERAFINPLRQGELRLRSSFIRELGRGWSADAGFLLAWETESIEPYRQDVSVRMELRPHQQIAYAHLLGERLAIEHSYKMEERFFEQQNEQGAYQDAGIAFEKLRMKYSVEMAYRISERVSAVVFNELVFHTGRGVGPNPFDRNEAGGGFILKLSEDFALETVYNYRYSPEGVRAVLHQHIGRFTLVQRLHIKKPGADKQSAARNKHVGQ